MTATRNPARAGLTVALAVLLLAPALSGCSDVRSAVGLEKQRPDEFAVLSHAPLSVPPDFGLRPPKPGAERPQQPSGSDGARDLLVNASRQATADESGGTAGSTALKRQFGTHAADPNIRAVINEESATYVYEEDYLIDTLLGTRTPAQGVVVDAAREQQRLEENAAAGKPVTEGGTPVIKRKRGGLFEDLF